MPSIWGTLERPPSGSLVPFQPADCFPVFKSGDVIISTQLGPSPKTFQLHSSVLSRHSPWFARALQSSAQDETKPSWYSFAIKDVDGKVTLVRESAEGERPKVSHSQQPEIIDGVQIKLEDAADEVSTAPSSTSTDTTVATSKVSPSHCLAVACYMQIFGTFYSIPPRVSTTNVGEALIQSEHLVKIAAGLGCVHLLQSHIGNTLFQYRQKLFLAIKSDPARWIQLALALEDRSIYTECVVHIVGAHPRWPWSTRRTALPECLRRLIVKKSQELGQARTEIERDLLLSTIPYGKTGRALNPANRGETETWIVVQVFRDLIAQRINALDRNKEASLHRGTLFRGIQKGTLPWLDTEYVRNVCQGIMQSSWQDLSDDLRRLKEYAADVVEELATNELMIDPDTNDVGYLTCVKVKNEDIPWLATAQQTA